MQNMLIWDINKTYDSNGTAVTLYKMLQDFQVKKPSGYRKEEVEEILATYQEKASTEETAAEKPNIIVIMNESFADMIQAYELGTKDNIPFTRNLMQSAKTIESGTMYSSGHGGQTANIEYEFLTQNATTFLPTGTIPYQQYMKENRDNIARNLKEQGYQTSAIHTWYKSGYSREKVYHLFGFDQATFLENVPEIEVTFNGEHPTDQATYQEVLKQFHNKEEGKPFFNFTVTMQNHMPYSTQQEGGGQYVEDEELNCYLQLMKQADEGLEYLIRELEKEEEKVILVFFGDHQPNIGALEVDTEESNAYKVPYFIWANYDTGVEPKREQNTSANFLQSKLMEIAGLPKTGYMQYLLELQESLPVICAKFYQDATGTMYRADDKTSEYQAKKEEYHKLVYYKMFEK